MVQALNTLSSAVAGLFGNQTRRQVQRQVMPSSTAIVATAKDRKTANMIRKEADKERLFAFISQPEIMGLAITFGGVYLANKIRFSHNEAQNDLLQGILTTASVLEGCGHAGVGDMSSLSLAISAGGASVLGSIVGDDANLNPFTWKWPLGPIWNW